MRQELKIFSKSAKFEGIFQKFSISDKLKKLEIFLKRVKFPELFLKIDEISTNFPQKGRNSNKYFEKVAKFLQIFIKKAEISRNFAKMGQILKNFSKTKFQEISLDKI